MSDPLQGDLREAEAQASTAAMSRKLLDLLEGSIGESVSVELGAQLLRLVTGIIDQEEVLTALERDRIARVQAEAVVARRACERGRALLSAVGRAGRDLSEPERRAFFSILHAATAGWSGVHE